MVLTEKQKKNFEQAKEYFATHPDAHKWKKMGHTPNTLDYFDSPTFIKVGDRILMTENNADKTIGKGAFAKVLKCCDETGQEYAVRVSGIPIQTELLTKELEKQHEQQNAKMKIIKDKGLTDFSNYMIR